MNKRGNRLVSRLDSAENFNIFCGVFFGGGVGSLGFGGVLFLGSTLVLFFFLFLGSLSWFLVFASFVVSSFFLVPRLCLFFVSSFFLVPRLCLFFVSSFFLVPRLCLFFVSSFFLVPRLCLFFVSSFFLVPRLCLFFVSSFFLVPRLCLFFVSSFFLVARLCFFFSSLFLVFRLCTFSFLCFSSLPLFSSLVFRLYLFAFFLSIDFFPPGLFSCNIHFPMAREPSDRMNERQKLANFENSCNR